MTTQTAKKQNGKTRADNPADVADDARRKVLAIREALCTFLTERDDAVELSIAALCTNEHTFLMGPPGTGKSLLNDSIAACVDGRYCDRLMHKAMTPDELVGALDLAKFQAEKVYRRNLDGGCPIDEDNPLRARAEHYIHVGGAELSDGTNPLAGAVI